MIAMRDYIYYFRTWNKGMARVRNTLFLTWKKVELAGN